MSTFLLPPPGVAKICIHALSMRSLRLAASSASAAPLLQPVHQPSPLMQSAHPLVPCLLRAAALEAHAFSSTSATSQHQHTAAVSAQEPFAQPQHSVHADHLSSLMPYKRETHPITNKPHAHNPLSRGNCTLEVYRLPGWVPPASKSRSDSQLPLLSVPEATTAACAAINATPGSQQAHLLESAIQIIAKLREENELAYISGGWVRDALLGRPSADIDIATSASVQTQVPLCMHDYHTKQLTRGMARLTRPGLQFEVAQFRGPIRENVMGSAYLDACLRDFTINAIFFDPLTGDVLDFVGGVQDLKNKVLRMPPYGLSPHKATDVFSTDPIRVLRAVRFASGFGLTVDASVTKREIAKHAHRCKFDTPEANRGALNLGNRRLHKELHKLASTVHSSPWGSAAVPHGLALAAELGVLQAMFPSIAKDPDDGQDLGYLTPPLVRRVQDVLPVHCPIELRLAALVNPWAPATALGQLDGLLLSMKDQSQPGPQQLLWDMEPVEVALQYVHFLAGLFKPLEDQEPDSPLWRDGLALMSYIDSQDKAAYIRLLVHKHALAFEAAALAHLSNDEDDLPSPADGTATYASNCSDDSSSSPQAFVASRLRLVRSVWAADIKMHAESQARMEERRRMSGLQQV
ncbi:hypothetical protein DUNSADRAFT_13989 [Dunaliella salina]|uniref:Poly A polymerase head domain-containing protein n=1 Tax=Dunaliella salina TaxID=3046 RepID=A0ABQ7G881_DUNSA|nr:hypothetical protein DUNSADRAFT_13989 [Dunaliella salina]|eukprot:KAF5830820.1 hypothetical protein DUNSADRAFT_13989 [Dunaliella salina]